MRLSIQRRWDAEEKGDFNLRKSCGDAVQRLLATLFNR